MCSCLPSEPSCGSFCCLFILEGIRKKMCIRDIIIASQSSIIYSRRSESVLVHRISYSHYNHNAPKLIIVIAKAMPMFMLHFPAPFGGILPTPAPPVASAAQLVMPHWYPLGQHPPPKSAEHVIQPCAQLPVRTVPGAVIPLPVGAAIVSVLPETSVVEADAGQEVVSQFRPIWQHPPW